MLSSAPKSVPTREQFIQPYFIEIASDGAIKATCARFATLLKKRNIYSFLGKNILEIFKQSGKLSPELPYHFTEEALTKVIDLSISGSGIKPCLIRWIPTPVYTPEGETGSWQLSGMKIYPDHSLKADTGEYSRPAGNELQYQASLVKYVSDIIVMTDLQDQVIYWKKAAEKFYGIRARQGIGRQLGGMIRYEYRDREEEEVKRTFQEKGFWDGEAVYVSGDGKKSYLISSIRYMRDHEERITGIVAVNKDITENKLAQQERENAEMQLRQYSEQMTNILESIRDGFFVLDKDFRFSLWNHEAERITRLSSAEMVGQPIWEKLPELVDTDMYQSFQKAFSKKMTVTLEQYNERFDRWLEMSIYPSEQGLFAYFKDVTVRKKQEMLLALEMKVLEMNSSKKASLRALLNYFIKGIQKIFPGMYCCVVTPDDEGLCVKLLSAPGLPAIYAHAIDGLLIGPAAGSCGTAIYRKEKVITSDIETDPLWRDHKELALKFGLRACWSFPILDAKEDVLAALAVYYTTSKTPTPL